MADNLRWVKTHCARMDHGGCALIVGVKDNRIEKIKGDPDGFLNKGFVCPKGMASPGRLNHPARLRHPLKRVGPRGEGRWQEISWDEALACVAENLDRVKARYGARAVAFCQGMPKGLEHFALIRLANIFGSPNVVAVQDVCHAPREVSGMHTCGFYPVADLHHESRLAVLWGSNITCTNEEGQINSLLLARLKAGTELMVVDPRRSELAQRARYWLQLLPGTDHALAMAFLQVIIEEGLYDHSFASQWTHGFEELAGRVAGATPEKMSDITGVPARLIRESARAYAAARPAAIQWGNAIEQNQLAFDTTRTLVCLMAICGNLDLPGGNIQANEPQIMSLGRFVRAELLPDKRKTMIHAHHHTIARLMTVPGAYFRKAVIEEHPYPVKAAFMQCCNPLLTYADSRQTFDALTKLDFFSVTDIFMTPTAAMADIVLPAASHFEFNDLGHYGLGHGFILARPKVVDPPNGCWPDIKILNELGKLLTPGPHWYEDFQDLMAEVLAPSGLTYDQFAEKGYLKGPDNFQKYRAAGFKTPSGKVELRLSQAEKFHVAALPRALDGLQAEGLQENPDYPLILTSSKDAFYLHSSYRWVARLRKQSPEPVVEIHPETAARYRIADGDAVMIETPMGAITQTARLNAGLRPEVVHAAYGWWFPEAAAERQFDWTGSNFNMLTSTATLGREFGTPNLKGLRCRVYPKIKPEGI